MFLKDWPCLAAPGDIVVQCTELQDVTCHSNVTQATADVTNVMHVQVGVLPNTVGTSLTL